MPPLPINPNTKIKISGKAKPNITEDGLLKMARRLALEIANIALTWLYFINR